MNKDGGKGEGIQGEAVGKLHCDDGHASGRGLSCVGGGDLPWQWLCPTSTRNSVFPNLPHKWLSTSSLLVVGLIILVSAWVFSNFPSRQTFMATMAIFLTGSLVCVFSEGHFPLLLAGRII